MVHYRDGVDYCTDGVVRIDEDGNTNYAGACVVYHGHMCFFLVSAYSDLLMKEYRTYLLYQRHQLCLKYVSLNQSVMRMVGFVVLFAVVRSIFPF